MVMKEYSKIPKSSELGAPIFRWSFVSYIKELLSVAQSAGAVEYTDYTSAEG